MLDACLRISCCSEKIPKVAACLRIVWVKINRLLGFHARVVELPSGKMNEAEYAVCEAVSLVKVDGALCQLVCPGERTHAICRPPKHAIVAKTPCGVRMCPCAGWVEFHCPFGTGKRLLIAGPGVFRHESLGAKQEVIGFKLIFTQAHRSVSARSLHPATNSRHYGLGNFILQGKDVTHLPVVTLSPGTGSRSRHQ